MSSFICFFCDSLRHADEDGHHYGATAFDPVAAEWCDHCHEFVVDEAAGDSPRFTEIDGNDMTTHAVCFQCGEIVPLDGMAAHRDIWHPRQAR